MSALLGDQCKHGCHKKTRKYWFRQKRYVVYKSWLLIKCKFAVWIFFGEVKLNNAVNVLNKA